MKPNFVGRISFIGFFFALLCAVGATPVMALKVGNMEVTGPAVSKTTFVPGEQVIATVEVKNTGFKAPFEARLEIKSPTGDVVYISRDAKDAPGKRFRLDRNASQTFTYSLAAPKDIGSYTFRLRVRNVYMDHWLLRVPDGEVWGPLFEVVGGGGGPIKTDSKLVPVKANVDAGTAMQFQLVGSAIDSGWVANAARLRIDAKAADGTVQGTCLSAQAAIGSIQFMGTVSATAPGGDYTAVLHFENDNNILAQTTFKVVAIKIAENIAPRIIVVRADANGQQFDQGATIKGTAPLKVIFTIVAEDSDGIVVWQFNPGTPGGKLENAAGPTGAGAQKFAIDFTYAAGNYSPDFAIKDGSTQEKNRIAEIKNAFKIEVTKAVDTTPMSLSVMPEQPVEPGKQLTFRLTGGAVRDGLAGSARLVVNGVANNFAVGVFDPKEIKPEQVTFQVDLPANTPDGNYKATSMGAGVIFIVKSLPIEPLVLKAIPGHLRRGDKGNFNLTGGPVTASKADTAKLTITGPNGFVMGPFSATEVNKNIIRFAATIPDNAPGGAYKAAVMGAEDVFTVDVPIDTTPLVLKATPEKVKAGNQVTFHLTGGAVKDGLADAAKLTVAGPNGGVVTGIGLQPRDAKEINKEQILFQVDIPEDAPAGTYTAKAMGTVASFTVEAKAKKKTADEEALDSFPELAPFLKDGKVTICHRPPGNKDNPQTITIAPSAWPTHKDHGDQLGPCAETKVVDVSDTKVVDVSDTKLLFMGGSELVEAGTTTAFQLSGSLMKDALRTVSTGQRAASFRMTVVQNDRTLGTFVGVKLTDNMLQFLVDIPRTTPGGIWTARAGGVEATFEVKAAKQETKPVEVLTDTKIEVTPEKPKQGEKIVITVSGEAIKQLIAQVGEQGIMSMPAGDIVSPDGRLRTFQRPSAVKGNQIVIDMEEATTVGGGIRAGTYTLNLYGATKVFQIESGMAVVPEENADSAALKKFPELIPFLKDGKVTICHRPPGNEGNPQTITIAPSAWEAHKAHGDELGECKPKAAKIDIAIANVTIEPAAPKVGELVKVKVDIKNNGDDTGWVWVYVTGDAFGQGSVPSIKKNATATVEMTVTFKKAGPASITANNGGDARDVTPGDNNKKIDVTVGESVVVPPPTDTKIEGLEEVVAGHPTSFRATGGILKGNTDIAQLGEWVVTGPIKIGPATINSGGSTIDRNGKVSWLVQIPADAPSGEYTITALGAATKFKVAAAPPSGKPDIEVTGMTFSPNPPIAGARTKITVTGRNIGKDTADAGFVIRISTGGTELAATSASAALAPGAEFSIMQDDPRFPKDGTFDVKAVVSDVKREENKANNEKTVSVTVGLAGGPDLAILSVGVSTTPPPGGQGVWPTSTTAPVAGQTVAYQTQIKNVGTVTAPGTYRLTTLVNGAQVQSGIFGFPVSAGATLTDQFSYTFPTAGTYTLRAYIGDSVGTNNEATATVIVGAAPVAKVPDIELTGMTFAPITPIAGDPTKMTVTVRNIGTDTADAGFLIQFPPNGGIVIPPISAPSKLAPGAEFSSVQDNIIFPIAPFPIGGPTTGSLTIKAVVFGVAREENKANNEKSVAVTFIAPPVRKGPDLRVAKGYVSEPLPSTTEVASPQIGTKYALRAAVSNTGNANADNPFIVKFYVNDVQMGQYVNDINLAFGSSNLYGNGGVVTFPAAGTYKIRILIDNVTGETNTTNNDVTFTVTVVGGGGGGGNVTYCGDGPGSGNVMMNFEGGGDAASYLKQFGVTVTGGGIFSSNPTIKGIYSSDDASAKGWGKAPSGSNFFVGPQAEPSNFTFTFDKPCNSVSFTRVEMLVTSPSGTICGAWSATAFDASGKQVSSVSEGVLRGYTNFCGKTFKLTGPGIVKVSFSGSSGGYAGTNSPFLDDFVLDQPESKVIGPISGVVLIRDANTNSPNASDPDVGRGYAKLAIPGVNDIDGLKRAGTDAIFKNLIQAYVAAGNIKPVQRQVLTFGPTGGYASTGCASQGCDFINVVETTVVRPFSVAPDKMVLSTKNQVEGTFDGQAITVKGDLKKGDAITISCATVPDKTWTFEVGKEFAFIWSSDAYPFKMSISGNVAETPEGAVITFAKWAVKYIDAQSMDAYDLDATITGPREQKTKFKLVVMPGEELETE